MNFPRIQILRTSINHIRVPNSYFFGILCCVLGCNHSEGIKPVSPDAASNLLKIAGAYSQAMGKWQRPPGNVEELSSMIKQSGGNPAEILKSPLDGQDYVVVYGVDFGKLAAAGQSPTLVIAYEKTGQGGIRHVLIAPSQVRVMNATEFAAAPFPPGHTPQP